MTEFGGARPKCYGNGKKPANQQLKSSRINNNNNVSAAKDAPNGGWAATNRCPPKRSASRIEREVQDQDDELMALASIYDSDLFHVTEAQYSGHFCAFVQPAKPFHLVGLEGFPGLQETKALSNEIEVEFLPPITLYFKLLPDYPSTRKPLFHVSCKWLNKKQLSTLCKRMDEMWIAGEVVLFSWTQFLKEDSLTALGISDRLDLSWAAEKRPQIGEEKSQQDAPEKRRNSRNRLQSLDDSSITSDDLEDPRAIEDNENVSTLLATLLEYNGAQQENAFNASLICCGVCFDEKRGIDCMRFKGCEHSYCNECMSAYFEVQIREGNVKCLSCPNEKCSSQALPSQVRALVSPALFLKYDNILLTTTLDLMSDIVYCPRVSCRCAVLKEPNSTIGTCPACYFVFCILCNASYHGVEACRLKSEEKRKLYEEYTNGTQEQKQALESTYGKLTIQHLVNWVLSEQWVGENSKECPKCKTHIEKIDGCNKMACWKCNNYFCWLCLSSLSKDNPYMHFEYAGGSCYNRLFAGTFAFENEEEEEEEEAENTATNEENDEVDEGDADVVDFGDYL